jgi:DNA polymerase III alpha subunit
MLKTAVTQWYLLTFKKMKINQHSEQIYNQDDVCDLLMQGRDIHSLLGITVDSSVDLETAALVLEDLPAFVKYNSLVESMSTEEFDHRNQQCWFMPDSYQQLDIAEHVLSLCHTDVELQRCGHELLMYQERDLFNLLRYLKYLMDLMTENRLIWGVGRGSSVASYVLYLLGIHKINSLYYELDPAEFLR